MKKKYKMIFSYFVITSFIGVFAACGQNIVSQCEKNLVTFWMGKPGNSMSGLFNENKKVVFYSKDYYVKTDFSDGYALIGQNYDPEKDVPLFCSVVDVSGTTILQYKDSSPVYRIHISEQMFQYMLYDKDKDIDEHGFYDIHGNKAVYCDRRVAYFSGGFHEGYVVYHDLKKHKAFFMDKHGTFLKGRFGFPAILICIRKARAYGELWIKRDVSCFRQNMPIWESV